MPAPHRYTYMRRQIRNVNDATVVSKGGSTTHLKQTFPVYTSRSLSVYLSNVSSSTSFFLRNYICTMHFHRLRWGCPRHKTVPRFKNSVKRWVGRQQHWRSLVSCVGPLAEQEKKKRTSQKRKQKKYRINNHSTGNGSWEFCKTLQREVGKYEGG